MTEQKEPNEAEQNADHRNKAEFHAPIDNGIIHAGIGDIKIENLPPSNTSPIGQPANNEGGGNVAIIALVVILALIITVILVLIPFL